jgi:hypothetical protein
MPQINTTPDYKSAALSSFEFGFSVIPIIPRSKLPAVKWDPWLKGLSTRKIKRYWDKHPDHELGFIVGDGVIVFDADSPEAIAALALLEDTFDLTPNLTVKTSKGVHHYFRRPPETYAKSDAHSTEKHPERIDVKTGRALVVLPPSTDKQVDIDEAENADDLTEASQAFIDAVCRHNGREAPRPPVMKTPSPRTPPADMDQVTARINAMVQHVDADCGYEDWLHVLMAIYHETGGSDEGFAVANAWSSQGRKYCGEVELREKWQSFANHTEAAVTIGTIIKMLADRGIDWIQVCDAIEPQFEPYEHITIYANKQSLKPYTEPDHPLVRYSLRGKLHQLEKEAVDQVLILGDLALMGQITIFYAAPNTGKTLLTLWLLIAAIKSGKIDPSKVFYINVDDSLSGLIMKLRLAERYRFHMVAEGHSDFRADDLLGILINMIDNNQCMGVVIITDTLKKFTDIMSKRDSTYFSKIIRRFVMLGGTCIALAHVNKNPGRDGKPIYAGTTDIIEDADCAYTLRVIDDAEAHEKVVEFNNIKRRGDVCQQAAYRYSTEKSISYSELLLSVSPVDGTELRPLQQAEEIRSDAVVIDAIMRCIREGINSKMDLSVTAAKRSGISTRAANKVIEKYTGSDPALHKWSYVVRERGKKVFSLLDPGTMPDSPEDTKNLIS